MQSLISDSGQRMQELIMYYRNQTVYLLETSVKVSRCTRHNGFNEEGLLSMALLVAPYDTEAPALIVGLLQDNVPTPVEVTKVTSS